VTLGSAPAPALPTPNRSSVPAQALFSLAIHRLACCTLLPWKRQDEFEQQQDLLVRLQPWRHCRDHPCDATVPAQVRASINLKTAKALGLTIPVKLLTVADEVIE
jgi:hypothetical protein